MATLIVYVPFSRYATPRGDLRENAAQLARAPFNGRLTRTGATIDNVVVVYRYEENYQVQMGDIVCLHAHGGPGADLDAGDNRGETATLDDLLNGLATLGAGLAQACYFAMCYSAEPNHVAWCWKQQHPYQHVFGAYTEMQGALVRETRRAVISCIFDASNTQLHRLP